MKKPRWQWSTGERVAVRLGEAPAPAGPRAEAFAMAPRERPEAGPDVPCIVFGLDEQTVPDAMWAEMREGERADVVFAARAWLVARGRRSLALRTRSGREIGGGLFDVRELDDELGGPRTGPLITLCPSNAEMIHALGVFDRVIACESSSDHPPEVASVERLGPDLDPDLDRVAALNPDLVISSLSVPGMERIVTGLRARGVRQLVLAPRGLDDVRAELVRLGAAIGAPAAAAAALERFDAEIEALRQKPAPSRGGGPVRVYLEWWPRPMFTPGVDCYSNELIALAGGVNVFANRSGSSVEIATEELLAADPQVCFVSWCGAPLEKLDPRRLIDRPGLESLAAARAGHVYALDERFSGRPGPRMLEAARVMRHGICTAMAATDA